MDTRNLIGQRSPESHAVASGPWERTVISNDENFLVEYHKAKTTEGEYTTIRQKRNTYFQPWTVMFHGASDGFAFRVFLKLIHPRATEREAHELARTVCALATRKDRRDILARILQD